MSQNSVFALLFHIIIGAALSSAVDGDVCFAISGAGGRIGQEVALLEAVVQGYTPSGQKIRPNIITGSSAGALSAIALNAILQNADTGSPQFTFDDFKRIILGMKSSSIYDNSYFGIEQILQHNIFYGYLLNNKPMEKWVASALAEMNYSKFKDCYLPTQITVVNQTTGVDIRLWSNDTVHGEYDMLELLMATAAMPLVFAPRSIDGLGGPLIDGGTGIDFLPVASIIDKPNVSALYLFTYNSALTGWDTQLPYFLKDIKIAENAVTTMNCMLDDLARGDIDMAARSSTKSYLYMPTLNQTWSSVSFDEEQEQYNLTAAWTRLNDPTPLN